MFVRGVCFLDFLVCFRIDAECTSGYHWRQVENGGAEAGVTGGVRLHRLRHYWATTLANEGKATPWELLEWGGWASLDMVRRYYHAPLRVNRGPVEALERAARKSPKRPPMEAKESVPRGKVVRARPK